MRRLLLALLILVPSVWFASGVAASADTPGCDEPTGDHCYSELVGSGTGFYGLLGSWCRCYMFTAGTSSNLNFMNSEMWFVNSTNYWVEEGIQDGWDYDIGKLAYKIFNATDDVNGHYTFRPMLYTAPNDTYVDQFEISQNTTLGVWDIWYNGTSWVTPNTGFYASDSPRMGAEIATPVGHAHTFNMYSQAENSLGGWQNWGTQTGEFLPPGIGGVILNGVHYTNSGWSWNTVAP